MKLAENKRLTISKQCRTGIVVNSLVYSKVLDASVGCAEQLISSVEGLVGQSLGVSFTLASCRGQTLAKSGARSTGRLYVLEAKSAGAPLWCKTKRRDAKAREKARER